MPQQDKAATPPRASLEGRVLEPKNEFELKEALTLAFDYRGDVTLEFKDGHKVDGFLFRYDEPTGDLHVFVVEGKTSTPSIFKSSNIARIVFSGPDIAFGRSWDDWMAKSQAQRDAEAERLRAESEKLGHL
jgi:hypothetical protein